MRYAPAALRSPRSTSSALSWAILTVVLLTGPSAALAQGWDPEMEGGEVVVIQDRPVELRHEFAVGAAVLPLDAWYTGYALQGSYTYHPSRLVAWEVASGFLADDFDSGLQDELLDDFRLRPARFEKVRAGLFSHLVLKPLYGKRAFMNEGSVTAETQLLLGAGIVEYSQSTRAAGDIGLSFRLHLLDWFSTRLTVRNMMPVDITGGVDNVLIIDLSGAFNFSGTSS